jgi:hypothetical protein
MPFVPFGNRFPKLARDETRSIQQFQGGIQESAHLLLELFCDEPGCDCRRVYVHVVSDAPEIPQPRAIISWGWESEAFYRKWASFPLDDADLDELRGPALARMQAQSEDAPRLLEQFRMVLADRSYAARIVRHYELFRASVEEGGPSPQRGGAFPINRAERRLIAARQRRRR